VPDDDTPKANAGDAALSPCDRCGESAVRQRAAVPRRVDRRAGA
jgi:hypothetical protein